MKIFDWQDIPMYGQNVQDVYDELFYRSERAGMEAQDNNVIMDVVILNTYLWNCLYTEAPKDKLVDFQIEFFRRRTVRFPLWKMSLCWRQD